MDLILSLVTLSALALVAGAIFLWRRNGAGRQVWLMLLLAVVMIANVLVWAIPGPGSVPEPQTREAVQEDRSAG